MGTVQVVGDQSVTGSRYRSRRRPAPLADQVRADIDLMCDAGDWYTTRDQVADRLQTGGSRPVSVGDASTIDVGRPAWSEKRVRPCQSFPRPTWSATASPSTAPSAPGGSWRNTSV